MSRYRTRTSRTLIGILLVTIVLGIVAYFSNTSSSNADTKPQAAAAAPAPLKTETPAIIKPQAKADAPNSIPAIQMTPPAPGAQQSGPTTQESNSNNRVPTPAEPSQRGMAAADVIGSAERAMAAGDLLGARKMLNDALVNNQLTAAGSEARAKKMLADINATVVFSPRKFADDEFGGTYSVRSGDSLAKIAANHNITWELLGRLNGISDPKKLRAGATLKVANGPFHAVVSKSNFTMDIYLGNPGGEGSVYVTTFPVGLGADDSTPTGTWQVEQHKKIKNPTYFSPRGEGVIEASDPKNPLGEFWIGLVGIDGHAVGKSSYGIHGTIEPDSIGKMESMGCIRLRDGDIDRVYELLIEGQSKVVVKQ